MTVTAIGLKICPANFGCLTSAAGPAWTDPSSGYAYVDYDYTKLGFGGALVSVGGSTTYNGPGRMLTDLLPVMRSNPPLPLAAVRTKDHFYADSGRTVVYGVSLFKNP